MNFDWVGEGVAYLQLNTLDGEHQAEFEAFFRRFFEETAANGARGLIIDLRDNDGGSTAVADHLLGYLTDRPYRLLSKKRWRVSAFMQSFIGGIEPARARNYLASAPGEYLTQVVEPTVPPRLRHRYTGPTVALIGPGTRSAAMMAADAMRSFNLALLVGEPTSTPPNFFGEVYRYEMQNSGLPATISTAAFVGADGNAANRQPVIPHIVVPTTLDHRLNGRDGPLEFAKDVVAEWLLARGR